MRFLTQADIASFLTEKPVAAIHFHANWKAEYRTVTRIAMADAEQVLAERVNFGEVLNDSINLGLSESVISHERGEPGH